MLYLISKGVSACLERDSALPRIPLLRCGCLKVKQYLSLPFQALFFFAARIPKTLSLIPLFSQIRLSARILFFQSFAFAVQRGLLTSRNSEIERRVLHFFRRFPFLTRNRRFSSAFLFPLSTFLPRGKVLNVGHRVATSIFNWLSGSDSKTSAFTSSVRLNETKPIAASAQSRSFPVKEVAAPRSPPPLPPFLRAATSPSRKSPPCKAEISFCPGPFFCELKSFLDQMRDPTSLNYKGRSLASNFVKSLASSELKSAILFNAIPFATPSLPKASQGVRL